jgi:hypothetical protein
LASCPDWFNCSDYGIFRPVLQRLVEHVTLMYVGRGDLTGWDLSERTVGVPQTFPRPAWAAYPVLGKAPLIHYVRDGLARLAGAT